MGAELIDDVKASQPPPVDGLRGRAAPGATFQFPPVHTGGEEKSGGGIEHCEGHRGIDGWVFRVKVGRHSELRAQQGAIVVLHLAVEAKRKEDAELRRFAQSAASSSTWRWALVGPPDRVLHGGSMSQASSTSAAASCSCRV